MKKQKLPSRAVLLSLLVYDPESGSLTWLPRGDNAWDARFAGKPALIAHHSAGYLSGAIYGRQVFAHRVIWKLVYGEEPDAVDHLDGNRRNNALSNLRGVTNAMNHRNRGRHKTNTSGVAGVYWHSVTGKWYAQVRHCGARKSKSFDNFDEAVAWRCSLARPSGYTERHLQAG